MVASRQDAWTEDDDLVLAEVTLRHIREGGTQLAAFEEVGQRLGRTAAACGFRWNSTVRKQYDAAIAIAKTQRQQLKKSGRIQQTVHLHEEVQVIDTFEEKEESVVMKVEEPEKNPVTAEGLIPPLFSEQELAVFSHAIAPSLGSEVSKTPSEQQVESAIRVLGGFKDVLRKHKHLEKELENREREVKELRAINQKLKKEVEDSVGVNNDYKALLQIMDRARRLAFLKEEENQKPVFKMDQNGNLERVE
ncbi:RsfA family transcriptional regulator [Brevibacillus daliensis]|uniref:RsfA family transcriptional regulator n=1 Tax=Brevibacillus daliensis TaxID=2892995 RepID=UPI001E5D35D6|nr:RsfA family transcriptional regulator [Brevibacillus daliensis]